MKNLFIDWHPVKKQGKRILSLEFSIKTARQLAFEAVEQDRRQINQMPLREAVAMAWQLMQKYKLKPWQKDRITADFNLLEIFFRVDAELVNGLRPQVKHPTAYLVKSLGLDQQVAPPKPTCKSPKTPPVNAPTLPLDTAQRTGLPQSLASILSNLDL